MVSVHKIPEAPSVATPEAERPARRPPTVPSIDARLSAWGQATRRAIKQRAGLLVDACQGFAEEVGRSAEYLPPGLGQASGLALQATDDGELLAIAAALLPETVRTSCRILWVDPEKLRFNLERALAAYIDEARHEVRRKQALYRRRARLWKDDPVRLARLRDEVESLRVPRVSDDLVARLVGGLRALMPTPSAVAFAETA